MVGRSKGDDGKTDMERVGVFSEVGYTTIGDRYPKKNQKHLPFNKNAYKGKQMMTTHNKSRSAQQYGYFEGVFKRIMEKEAYINIVQAQRTKRLSQAKKRRGKGTWIPSDYPKKPSGLGNHYGTLAGPITHFVPNSKPKEEKKRLGRNVTTNPSKKGTGYGYVGVTLGDYHAHAVEPYERPRELRIKENEIHHQQVKGKAFRLNNHPTMYFDHNPFKDPTKLPSKSKSAPDLTEKKTGEKLKPFKISSPPKKTGGCKAGCFTTYPKHSEDAYAPKKAERKNQGPKKLFRALPGPKSVPTPSIMQQCVQKAVNKANYKSVKAVMSFSA